MSKMFIRIYSDIRSCHFLDTNIFGYSFVSKSIRMSHSVTELVEGETNIDSDLKDTFSNILYREAMFSNSPF